MNTEKQIDENIEASFLLSVWKQVSKKFRKKVSHEAESPLTLASFLADNMSVAWMEPKDRKEALGENLDNYRHNILQEVDVETLDMVMRVHQPPAELLAKYESNAALDSVAKKTWARWERWGDAAVQEVVPIHADMEIIKKEMRPVIEAFSEWVVEEKDAIVDTMKNIFATKRKHMEFDEWVHRRTTPPLETYLTQSQISQLAPELEALRAAIEAPCELGGRPHMLLDTAGKKFAKKLGKFKQVLRSQEIDPDDVLTDAINYDCLNEKYTRDPSQIIEEETRQRQAVAKNLPRPARSAGDSTKSPGTPDKPDNRQR